MNPSAKGSNKVKTGMAAFVILFSATGAGVYAYVEPNSATPNTVALDSQWRGPTPSDKKEQVISAPPSKSDARQHETSRRNLMRLHDKKQTEAQESSNNPRDQSQSLSDSDKRKILVVLALWSIKP